MLKVATNHVSGPGALGRAERLRLAFLAALIASFALALPAAAATPDYVSLGDSYVAGPFIPAPLPPYGGLKSDHNYAHLAAPRLELALHDPSCSGAESDDMTQPQGVSPGPNPPQLDSIDADTQLVTLGPGGNDIGCSSLATDCLSSTSPHGSPCRDKYVVDGTGGQTP